MKENTLQTLMNAANAFAADLIKGGSPESQQIASGVMASGAYVRLQIDLDPLNPKVVAYMTAPGPGAPVEELARVTLERGERVQ